MQGFGDLSNPRTCHVAQKEVILQLEHDLWRWSVLVWKWFSGCYHGGIPTISLTCTYHYRSGMPKCSLIHFPLTTMVNREQPISVPHIHISEPHKRTSQTQSFQVANVHNVALIRKPVQVALPAKPLKVCTQILHVGGILWCILFTTMFTVERAVSILPLIIAKLPA